MPALRRIEWERSCPISGANSALIAGSGALGMGAAVWNTILTNWNASTMVWGI